MSATFLERGPNGRNRIARELDYAPWAGITKEYSRERVKLATGEHVRLQAHENGFDIEHFALGSLPLGLGTRFGLEPTHREHVMLRYVRKDAEGKDKYEQMIAKGGNVIDDWKPFDGLTLANGQTVEPSIIYPPEQHRPGKGRGIGWWPT